MARVAGGGVLISVGIAGLLLPVLPGWIFIVPGLSLWSSEFHWAARLRVKAAAQLDRVRSSHRPPVADISPSPEPDDTDESRRIA